MKYKRAVELIPTELLAQIQEYVDGEYLYIPRKCSYKKRWGEKNGYKNKLKKKNQEIFNKYDKGYSVEQLAEEYFLSDKSIYNIIANYKKVI